VLLFLSTEIKPYVFQHQEQLTTFPEMTRVCKMRENVYLACSATVVALDIFPKVLV